MINIKLNIITDPSQTFISTINPYLKGSKVLIPIVGKSFEEVLIEKIKIKLDDATTESEVKFRKAEIKELRKQNKLNKKIKS